MARSADAVEIEIDGHTVRVSSPDKVLFEERGDTKLDLVNYYAQVAAPIMRTMGGRPVLMQRFPHGAGGSSFFQKRVPDNAPEWLQTTVVSTPNGTTSNALVIADAAHITWAVNLGCLGFHVWPSLADDPGHAVELRIDLDPSPGVDFEMIRAAAFNVKAFCDEIGIDARPKTTGNRGIHVYARLEPKWDSYDVRLAAIALARELERRHPDLMTAAWWKEERGARVFIDFNQNAPHKTIFGAWCVRARPGAQVSFPFGWEHLDTISIDDYTIAVVPTLLHADGDPWEDVPDHPQSIAPLLEMSRRDADNGLLDMPWPPVYPKMPNEPPRVAPEPCQEESKEQMSFTGWPVEALDFYAKLEANNSRAWWLDNKTTYDEAVKAPFLELSELIEKEFGPLRVFRPNRDIRFSKDKTPYKTAAAAHTESQGGASYYVSVSAEGLYVGSGYYHLANDQLERYRRAVADNKTGPKFASAVATIGKKLTIASRDALKRVPRGFDAEHPRAELLKWKGVHAGKEFGAPKWLHTKAAYDRIVAAWREAKPLNTWLDKHVGPSNEAPPEPF